MEVFVWIEETFLSTWFREAIWAFPTLLVLHAVGMAFLVGTSVAINCRIIGLASQVSLQSLVKLYPVIYIAFVINLTSGLLLLLSYPAKALTNPVFYLKMTLVIVAFTLTQKQKTFLSADSSNLKNINSDNLVIENIISPRHKRIAILVLILWATSIISGRFLAYTHTWLLVS